MVVNFKCFRKFFQKFINTWKTGKFPKYLGIWEISLMSRFLGNSLNVQSLEKFQNLGISIEIWEILINAWVSGNLQMLGYLGNFQDSPSTYFNLMVVCVNYSRNFPKCLGRKLHRNSQISIHWQVYLKHWMDQDQRSAFYCVNYIDLRVSEIFLL